MASVSTGKLTSEESTRVLGETFCPRCKGIHSGLLLRTVPGDDIVSVDDDRDDFVWDSWAICPTTNAPILASVNIKTG